MQEWTTILDLAARWNFESIKTLAITELVPIASSVDKIVLGRQHHINDWLGEAYKSVCMRPDPLTYEEGVKLGMEDVIKVSAIRHKCGLGKKISSPTSLSEELQRHFGIDVGAQTPVHDAGISPAERPSSKADCNPVDDSRPGHVAAHDSVAKDDSIREPLTKAQRKKIEIEREAKEKAEREKLERDFAEADLARGESPTEGCDYQSSWHTGFGASPCSVPARQHPYY